MEHYGTVKRRRKLCMPNTKWLLGYFVKWKKAKGERVHIQCVLCYFLCKEDEEKENIHIRGVYLIFPKETQEG